MSNIEEHPYSIKFIIFDEIKKVTKKQLKIREKLCDTDLKIILENVVKEFPDKYKILVRYEPAISSLDEKKQLRMDFSSMLNQFEKYSNSLIFDQNHSLCKEYFTIEELKTISLKIKKELEDYLNYEICQPILYLTVYDEIET